MQEAPDDDVAVGFIGGTGRSGSTLLSRVLNEVPGICSVGELCWIWSYGVQNNRLCACGQEFHSCPFWTGVGERAFGGWSDFDVDRAITLRRKLMATTQIPVLWTGGRGAVADQLVEYRALMAALYRAIGEESGADIVLDNSKQTSAALIARDAPGIRLSVLQLVRRSHGVAYSWTKNVQRTDTESGGRAMRRRPPARTALRWVADNALFETMGRVGTDHLLIRYEDLIDNPRAVVERVLEHLGMPVTVGMLDFVTEDSVTLGSDHSVWGNPMRLRTGTERLRQDDGWRTGLSARDRRLVTALSSPGLLRYGYLRPTLTPRR